MPNPRRVFALLALFLFVPLSARAQEPSPALSAIRGAVYAMIPDGSGGWYLGGDFQRVGGLRRSHLAHVLADQTVSLWDPSTDGPVYALAMSEGIVYAGGDFRRAGGQRRARLAAIDAGTGLATP